jgi:hypothetical protein
MKMRVTGRVTVGRTLLCDVLGKSKNPDPKTHTLIPRLTMVIEIITENQKYIHATETFKMIPQTDDYTPALDTDRLDTMTEIDLSALAAAHDGRWPYSEHSNLLDRKMALNIRVLMLQYMSEEELNACSVRELLDLYVEFLGLRLQDLLGEPDPETKAWAAERARYVLGLDDQPQELRAHGR